MREHSRKLKKRGLAGIEDFGVNRPPNSPDTHQRDYFLWGEVKREYKKAFRNGRKTPTSYGGF